jgi:O-antigen/teichoic acid export membrane protein
MSLVVPKVLGVEAFSYWQLFLFYSGYVGFFLLGLNDGLYLRLGGEEYKDLNHSLIGSQFRVSMLFQIMIAVGIILYGLFFIEDINRQFVLFATASYLIIYNANGFIGFIFQAVNQTKVFSMSVIVDKIFFIVAVLVLLLFRVEDFETFIILFLFGGTIALFYCIWMGRRFIFSKPSLIRATIKEMLFNISVGANLMFANIASMLILGNSRFVIDNIWGITAFGKFSLSLSLCSFFLLFIRQISIVLFPTLRQSDEQELKEFYNISRDMLGVMLAGVLLAYMPMKYLLGLWLPQYQESLAYLALLLPLCTFDGKMQMLCSTYLKVLRKEKILFGINVVTLILSVCLTLIGGYWFKSIHTILVFIVVAVAFRSTISELYIAKIMKTSIWKSLAVECTLVAIFMVCTWNLSSIKGFSIYLIVYFIYLIALRNKIKNILKSAKKLIKK